MYNLLILENVSHFTDECCTLYSNLSALSLTWIGKENSDSKIWPLHDTPSSSNSSPVTQEHSKLPTVFSQVTEQPPLLTWHSFTSEDFNTKHYLVCWRCPIWKLIRLWEESRKEVHAGFAVNSEFFTNAPQYKNTDIANFVSAVPSVNTWTKKVYNFKIQFSLTHWHLLTL